MAALSQRNLPILVTASPRSGTGYCARFLRAQGLSVGHERLRPDGCVSWQWAVEDIHGYPWHPPGELRPKRFRMVLHQTRNPLAVIASLEVLRSPDWMFVARHLPNLPSEDLPRRCAFWLAWTSLADRCSVMRYRVEDLREQWPYINAALGKGHRELTAAARALPPTVNSRPHRGLRWADILALRGIGERVALRAQRYGYQLA